MDETIPLDSIQAIAASFGASFCAEKIIDTVLEKDGTRYYKVRWVKYSWEPTSSFIHLEHLIRDFWIEFEHHMPGVQEKVTLPSSEILNVQPKAANEHELIPQFASLAEKHSDKDEINSLLSTFDAPAEDVSQVNNIDVEVSHSFTQLAALNEVSVPLEISDHDVAMINQIASQESRLHEKRRNRSHDESNGECKKRRKIPGNCPICGKHFKSTTNIAAHKKLHTEERQFNCSECGKKFRRKLHLRRHLESHAGVKSFVCEVCGSAFTSKWYMEAHAVIHTGEKPFQCDVCEKKFNNKANLNKHRQIHVNKRPFVCNICGQSYRHSYDLKRHMSTHSVSKDFTCSECGKKFARKTYLQRHALTHTTEKKYCCTLCNKKFLQKSHFNLHLKQHSEYTIRVNESANCKTKAADEVDESLPESDYSKSNAKDERELPFDFAADGSHQNINSDAMASTNHYTEHITHYPGKCSDPISEQQSICDFTSWQGI